MLGCMSHSWKIAVSQQCEHGGEWSRGQEDQALEKKGPFPACPAAPNPRPSRTNREGVDRGLAPPPPQLSGPQKIGQDNH